MQIIHLTGHHCGCLLQNLALSSSLWGWTCTEQFLYARGKLPTNRHMNSKKWMLRHAAACFKTPMCCSKNGCCGMLRHAAAAHACLSALQNLLCIQLSNFTREQKINTTIAECTSCSLQSELCPQLAHYAMHTIIGRVGDANHVHTTSCTVYTAHRSKFAGSTSISHRSAQLRFAQSTAVHDTQR
jgi:hypothetical protein